MEHKPQKIEIKPRREGEPPSSIHLFVDGHEIKGIRKLDFFCRTKRSSAFGA